MFIVLDVSLNEEQTLHKSASLRHKKAMVVPLMGSAPAQRLRILRELMHVPGHHASLEVERQREQKKNQHH